jgi:hypothetical protein
MTQAAAARCPDIDALSQRLRGYRLPGGHYEITPATATEVARLTAWDAPQPHPVFASIASLRALGVSIEQLCALCEFRLEDGPMLGEFTAVFHGELRQGIPYRTEASIDSIDRRHSARMGALDRLRFTVRILLADGTPVADAHYLWLLPRGAVPP